MPLTTHLVRRSRVIDIEDDSESRSAERCIWTSAINQGRCNQKAMIQGFCFWHIRTAVVDSRYGLEIDLDRVDPRELILEEIARSSWTIHALETAFADLPPAELSTVEVKEERVTEDGRGSYVMTRYEPRMHPILETLRKEREHAVMVAKAALAAGIEERYVQLAEGQAQTIVSAMMNLIRELGLDPQDPSHRAAAARALEAARGDDTMKPAREPLRTPSSPAAPESRNHGF